MGRRILMLVVGLTAGTVVTLSASATPGSRDSTSQPAGVAHVVSVRTGGTTGSANREYLSDVADYWTEQRMRTAKPAERTVPGRTLSPHPSPNVVTPTAASPVAAAKEPTQKKRVKRKSSSTNGASGVSSGPATGTTEYWTQDKIDSAQPKDMTVPGGGDEAGSPDDGVGPVPVPATP